MKKFRFKLLLLPALCALFFSFSRAAQSSFNEPPLNTQTNVARQYICIGDSITNGHGNTSLEAYPHQLSLLLGTNSFKYPEGFVLPSGWLTQLPANTTLVVNYGLESQKIQTMLANVGSQVGSRLSDAGETRVVLLGGINDIGQGRTAADVQADWAAYGAWCNANNVKLYVGTMTALTDPSFNAARAEANHWLRNNWQNFAYKLVDFASNEALADATNLAYFRTDGVHPNAAGDLRMAQIANAVIGDTYQKPTITDASLPPAFYRMAFNRTLTVSGGDGAITWSHRGGELPSGITFNATTRKFEGTPTIMGTYPNIIIRATDATGDFHERTFSIVVTRKYSLCSRGFIRNCA